MKQGELTSDLRLLYKDDPLTLKKIDSYESQIEKSKKIISQSINTINLTKHPLDKTITDRPDIFSLVETGKSERNALFGPPLPSKHVPHDHDGDGVPDH